MHKLLTLVFPCFLIGISPAISEITHQIIDLDEDYNGLLKITGADINSDTGVTSSTGDIDGDGYEDLIIGALWEDYSERRDAGAIHVVFGYGEFFSEKSLNLSLPDAKTLKIIGEEPFDFLGYSSLCKDLNNDGFKDIIVSAYNADPGNRENAGKVYIIFGSAGISSIDVIDLRNPNTDVITINGGGNDENFGYSLACGDLNNDGRPDLIVGAPHAEAFQRHDTGFTYLISGNLFEKSTKTIDLYSYDRDFSRVFGETGGDQSGIGVSSTDVNGDGYDDAIIGAWYANRTNDSQSREGKVYIYYGSPAVFTNSLVDLGDTPHGLSKILGENSSNYLGIKMFAGNFDNDEYGDILIGAHGYSGNNLTQNGASYIIKGYAGIESPSVIDLKNTNTNIYKITGEDSQNHLCNGFFADVDGDDINEIIVAAADAYPLSRNYAGEIYVLSKSVLDNSPGNVIDLKNESSGIIRIYGEGEMDHAGYFISSGDLNNDKINDLIISSPGYGYMNKPGKVYALSGSVFFTNFPAPEYLAHFDYDVNTGNNATILIKADKLPKILGSVISPGDEIGVTTLNDLCGGGGVWTGNNLSITVWGDNPLDAGINGFLAGEKYYYRVWDKSDNKEYMMKAEYLSGEDRFRTDGITVINSLESETDTLTIFLNKGWNIISSDLIPADTRLNYIFSDISENIVLLKNGAGYVYWPEYDVNQISNWKMTDGYQIYVKEDCTLSIAGYKTLSKNYTYYLNKGWTLISYGGDANMAPLSVFYSLIGNLIILKDGMGRVFWPEYGIDQIEEMQHGKGYWIALKNQANFSYSESPAQKPAESPPVEISFFEPVKYTGNNSTILVKKDIVILPDEASLTAGDEIGVFTHDGICAGSCKWMGNNTVITVWGDDPMTDNKDGMLEGENYIVRIFDFETGIEYNADAIFSSEEKSYSSNTIAVIEKLIISTTNVETENNKNPSQLNLWQNYPNPFNSSTSIKFSLPEKSQVKLTVFNSIGTMIETLEEKELSPGTHTIEWNAVNYPSGLYFYRLEAGNRILTKRLMLLK